MGLRMRSIALRSFLVLVVLFCLGSSPAQASQTKNIILFIGDGMQLAHEVAASNYLYGEDYALVWHDFTYKNFVTTWNVDTYNTYAAAEGKPDYDPENFDPILGYNPEKGGAEPYPRTKATKSAFEYFFPGSHPSSPSIMRAGPATDSAASGTAISTGNKTRRGRIAWNAAGDEGGALVSIAQLFREKNGASIGVVSTVPFSHATPAVFSSHNKDRDNFYTGRQGYDGLGIANEILTVTMPEVVIGGGHNMLDNPDWDTNAGFVSKDVYEAAKSSETYSFVERLANEDGAKLLADAATVAVESGKKLFGLFGGAGGNFEPPVPANAPGAPRVDRATQENPLLGDVVVAALEVLSQNENGFFVLAEQGDIDWANHANNFGAMIGTLWDLNEAVQAAIEFVDRPGDSIDWDNTLLIVTADHANSYMKLNPNKRLGPGELPEQESDGRTFKYPDGKVKYYTNGHTNELVGIYAKGAGAAEFEKYEGTWYPGTRLIDNTQIFAAMKDAAIGD